MGADEQVLGLLRQAVELGVDHIDTAAFYPTFAEDGNTREFTGLNWANDAIRQALAPYSDDLVIATKVGPTESGLARPDQLRRLVEDNLRQLGLETLDVVYLHQTGLTSVAEHFGVLAELREAGLIRQLGLSNVRTEHLAQAQEIAPVVAVQNRYGVGFGRVNDEMIRVCGEQDIAFVPFFAVTGTGREAGGVADSDPVVAIAREHGARADPDRLDPCPGPACPGHPRHRQPGSPRREHRCRHYPAHRRPTGHPRRNSERVVRQASPLRPGGEACSDLYTGWCAQAVRRAD
jgi:pyridoxine 4-dehydrogenase